MLNVGIIGWRGLVGSVLLTRMLQQDDFAKINTTFFSTSDMNHTAPNVKNANPKLLNSYDIDQLIKLDVIITTQGSDYTKLVFPQLQSRGFKGYWIDASSYLRMHDKSMIVLDPLNIALIQQALFSGIKIYSGGNCTVSVMLMALQGLVKTNSIQWINSATYQAISGAGAGAMHELLLQCGIVHNNIQELVTNPDCDILDIETKIKHVLCQGDLPINSLRAPLAYNLLPWIDAAMSTGQTREEWKGSIEANKILGLSANTLKIDGICVRVPSMRCHAQALTIKLNQNIPLPDIVQLLQQANPWVRIIKNDYEETINKLTPLSVSGTLDIAIGRIRKLSFGSDYLTLFTVADQLLWGAAEPLRRMLNIIIDFCDS